MADNNHPRAGGLSMFLKYSCNSSIYSEALFSITFRTRNSTSFLLAMVSALRYNIPRCEKSHADEDFIFQIIF